MVLLAGVAHASSPGRSASGAVRNIDVTRDGALFSTDWLYKLAFQGRIFIATDADANDTVTGQTSFADTTPTFSLEVPSGVAAILLRVSLGQVGAVAGGAVTVNMAISSGALSRASGGTAETVYCARTDAPAGSAQCTLYSGPTATTALLTKNLYSTNLIGPDVSSAEGALNEVLWTPARYGHPVILMGPAALGVFTWAATTGPTWAWSFVWAEVPSTDIVG